MKNIRVFLSGNFQFLEVKFSVYLNRRIFIMLSVQNWSFYGLWSSKRFSSFIYCPGGTNGPRQAKTCLQAYADSEEEVLC